jgi:phage-related protein
MLIRRLNWNIEFQSEIKVQIKVFRARQGAGNSQFLRDSCQAEPPNSAWASGVQIRSLWIDSQ